MRFNKKGSDFAYNTIGSFIIGILIVGIAFYWMFNVYFTEESIDWEVCRESLILRNALPEEDLGVKVASTKSLLPLKCGTQTITIDYEDTERAEKEIGETISSCWYMVGRGDYSVFPGKTFIFRNAETPCMMCARIHIDREVRDFYSEAENIINIERGLDSPLEGYDVSIWDYLNPTRGARAFMYFKDWSNEGFEISYEKHWTFSGLPDDAEAFVFPRYMTSDKGDLFIAYAEPVTEASDLDIGRGAKPYMVLLQYNDFDKLSEPWVGYETLLQSKVCSSIETIPS